MTFHQIPRGRFDSLQRYILLIVLALMVGLLWLGNARPFDEPSMLLSEYGRPFLAFVPNAGQNDTAVQYQAHLPGANLFFTDEGLTVGWAEGGMRLNFLGTSSSLAISGREAQPGVVNYMVGNDPDNWQTGLPTYGVVTYEGLYPGVSLAFNGQGSQLAAVFQIEPNADPANIGWAFEWVKPVLDETGALQLVSEGAAETAVTLSPPQAWQEVDGRDVDVTAAFRLDENGRVGLELGELDGGRPLAISTIMTYGSGGSWDIARAIAAGPTGKAYVSGETAAPIFPLANPYQPEYGGGATDAFVTVFTPDGQSLVYSTFLGGSERDAAFSIAVDNNDRAFVLGSTGSTDFPLVNPIQNYGGGYADTFVTVLTPDGQSLSYSTYLGGSDTDGFFYLDGSGIVLDGSGRAYVTGSTMSSDFPLVNPKQPVFGGERDAFVSVIAPDGQSLVFSTFLGGSSADQALDIAIDGNSRIHVGGYTTSSDFPLVNPLFPDLNGYDDAFVTVYAPNGQSLEYSTYLGGNSGDYVRGIGVNSNGQTYVTGYTWSSNFPLANPFQPDYQGLTDVFVTVFAQDGQSLIYSTYLGRGDYDNATSLVIDGSGRVYIAGRTYSSNFPLVNPLLTFGGGHMDAFITVFSPDGQSLDYSTFLGGSSNERVSDIDLDGNSRIYVTGSTSSDDFPLADPIQPTYGGSADGFVSVIAHDGQALEFSTYLNGAYPGPTSVDVSGLGKTAEPNPALYLLALGLLVLLFVGVWLGNCSRNYS
jgi:hypothetical protein